MPEHGVPQSDPPAPSERCNAHPHLGGCGLPHGHAGHHVIHAPATPLVPPVDAFAVTPTTTRYIVIPRGMRAPRLGAT